MLKARAQHVLVMVFLGLIAMGCMPPRAAAVLTSDAKSEERLSSIVFGVIKLKPADVLHERSIQIALLNDLADKNSDEAVGYAFLQVDTERAETTKNYVAIPFAAEVYPTNWDFRSITLGSTVCYPKKSVDSDGQLIVHDSQYPFTVEPDSLSYIGSLYFEFDGKGQYSFEAKNELTEDIERFKGSYPQLYNEYKDRLKTPL